jgi:hypothetical protein
MTETAAGRTGRKRTAPADPFVIQIGWLVATAGGKEQLVQRCGGLVSERTLDNWTAGSYPRTKITGAVRDLDAWARQAMPGYPDAAGAPSLIEASGPYRSAPAVPEPAVTSESTPERRPRQLRWALWAAAVVVVLVAAVVTTVVVVRHDDAEQAKAAAAAAARSAATVPLPSTGDGTSRTELTGSIGAKTFADPRTLTAGGGAIPANTEIQVRCRYYAPSVPSVTPDGFWYLIESDQWNGLWTPANSFMNGDVPGGPYTHNTDFDVPICR